MKNLKISPRLALGLVVAAFLLLAFGLYKTFAHPAEVTDTNALASEIQANNPKNAPSLPPGVDPTKGARGMGSKSGSKPAQGSPDAPAPGSKHSTSTATLE